MKLLKRIKGIVTVMIGTPILAVCLAAYCDTRGSK